MFRLFGDRRQWPGYDWHEMRDWSISYARLFLEYAGKPGDKDTAYKEYRAGLDRLALDKRRLRNTERMTYEVFNILTGDISEAVATEEALPGDFQDMVEVAKAWLAFLEKAEEMSPDYVARELARLSQ